MPQRTGTRTAARNVSRASGAAACPAIIAEFQRARTCRAQKNWAAAWPPKGLFLMTQLRTGFLVGFHNHRSQAETEGDTENDGKHRDPHGVASSFACAILRGKSGGSNAQKGIWFLGSPRTGCGLLVIDVGVRTLKL